MLSGDSAEKLDRVWLSIYDDRLTDEQVCRLAAKHNIHNTGSRQTKWLERVSSCRDWLYLMNQKDVNQDETPSSTTAWKKACQMMYLNDGKVSTYFLF